MSAHTTALAVGGSAVVNHSRIDGNAEIMSAYSGTASASGGGIEQEAGSLLLENSDVSRNSLSDTITSTQTTAGASTDGGAMETNGPLTVSNTTFIGNTMTSTGRAGLGNGVTAAGSTLFIATPTVVTMTNIVLSGNRAVATTKSGSAFVAGGLVNGTSMTLINSVIRGNTAKAASSTGTATVQGGGILNGASLTLKSTTVTNNTGRAVGTGGQAQGGGIYNDNPGGPPPVLTLVNSTVTHNVLTASNPKISVQGGGLFTTGPVTRKNTVIAHNVPDQCFGC